MAKQKVRKALQAMVQAFEDGDVSEMLARGYITNSPMRKWSARNQVMAVMQHMHLTGEIPTDMRNYKAWKRCGRRPISGRGVVILYPKKYKVVHDDGTEEWRLGGYGTIHEWDISQTKIDPKFKAQATEPDPAVVVAEYLDSLPLQEAAAGLGVKVCADMTVAGVFNLAENTIRLGHKSHQTWLHELVHAADYANGGFERGGQDPLNETVAELGAVTLAKMLGAQDLDDGGAWQYINNYAKQAGIDPVKLCGKALDRCAAAIETIISYDDELVQLYQ